MASPSEGPAAMNAAYASQSAKWTVLDDVWEGTDAMRAAGTTYVEQGPLEDSIAYQRRLKRPRFYSLFKQAVRGLAGLATSEPLSLGEDTDPVLAADAENIDGRGTHLSVFFKDAIQVGLRYGHVGILVDYPAVANPEAITEEDERVQGLAPFWVLIRPNQIINWRVERIGRVEWIRQVTIKETVLEADGTFGEREVTQYRVLARVVTPAGARVAWEVWRESTAGGTKSWVSHASGLFTLVTEIPLVFVPIGTLLGWFHTEPPLYDLAETNLDHFSVTTDHRASLNTSGVAVPVITGADADAIKAFGHERGLILPKDGTAGYMETSGQSLSASRVELLDLLARAASQGLSMVAPDPKSAETATAHRLDNAEQRSRLADAVARLQDGVEQAMVFHAQFRRKKPGRVTQPLELDAMTLSDQEVANFNTMRANGDLSRLTLWEILTERGALPRSFSAQTEEQRLAEEGGPATPDGGEGDGFDVADAA